MATKDELHQLSNNTFTDNDNGDITPEKHRTFNDTFIDSMPEQLPPNGNAGGDLSGTYPNPSVGAEVITLEKLAAEVKSRLKYREFSATLIPKNSSGLDSIQDTTEDNVIVGATNTIYNDTTGTNYGGSATWMLSINPDIFSKIVKSSVQATSRTTWPSFVEIATYQYPSDMTTPNIISVLATIIRVGQNPINQDRVFIRFLIAND